MYTSGVAHTPETLRVPPDLTPAKCPFFAIVHPQWVSGVEYDQLARYHVGSDSTGKRERLSPRVEGLFRSPLYYRMYAMWREKLVFRYREDLLHHPYFLVERLIEKKIPPRRTMDA